MVSTVSLYRSPVRLINHASEEASFYSPQAISRARKKMMAEIALAGDEIIIDDISYSRNDASSLLDFITEDSWRVHHIIYTHKGLLNFLEKEEFDSDELKKADAYLYNSKFVAAVSPYFAHSFNSVSGRLIKEDDFEKLTALLNYQGFILPEHSHESHQKIRNYLDELNYTLRNLSWEKFYSDESVLHFIFSDEWKRFINKLPTSFTALRDELAEQMIGIVLRFQHKATWYYLHQIMLQLKQVETNDFNRSEIERIDHVMDDNTKVESGRRKVLNNDRDGWSWRSVWWVVWVILIIIRVATCNSKKSSYNFDDVEIRQIQRLQQQQESKISDEQRNEPVFLHFLDSLGSKTNLPVYPLQKEMQTGDQPFNSFANDFPDYGEDTIYINNKTAHNCVALYIAGSSRSGSVYEGALPDVAAVYIKQGESFSFRLNAGEGKFYFLFGDAWGQLKQQTELPIYSERSYYDTVGRRHLLMLYEFFSNQKAIRQKYLQQAIFAEEATARKKVGEYYYLNNPYDAVLDEATRISLNEKNGKFSIEATGSLQIKEEKPDQLQQTLEEFKAAKIKPLKK